MRILLTGGSGFVGRACLRVAARAGHELLVFSRRPGPAGAAGRWVCVDLNDAASYEAPLAAFRPDAVIHLAWEGIPDYSLENSLRNVVSGARFAERVFAAGCPRLVAGGSCWEYGSLERRVRETDEPLRVGVFGACKTAQREVLAALATAAGASLAWARIFYVYGPGQKATSLAASLCADLLAGRPARPRTPHAINDFIYVDDVAEALVTLAETDAAGTFNVGSGTGVTVAAFTAAVARAAGAPLADGATEMPAGTGGLVADMGRLAALGWTPRTPLDRGVAATWSFFLGEHPAPC